MSKPITIYQAKIPVLTYINAQDELIVYILPDTSKGSLKSAASKILNIPKKHITVKDNIARSEEYLRQLEFKLGYINN